MIFPQRLKHCCISELTSNWSGLFLFQMAVFGAYYFSFYLKINSLKWALYFSLCWKLLVYDSHISLRKWLRYLYIYFYFVLLKLSPLISSCSTEFVINLFLKLYSLSFPSRFILGLKRYQRQRGLKSSRTLWGLPGYKSTSVATQNHPFLFVDKKA